MRFIRLILLIAGVIAAGWALWLLIYDAWEHVVFPPPDTTDPSILGFFKDERALAIRYGLFFLSGIFLVLLSTRIGRAR